MLKEIPDTSSLILRWTTGRQNTVSLSDYERSKYESMVWLTKLSIVSFQRWFPDAQFVLMYNGDDFPGFVELVESSSPDFTQDVEYINQVEEINERWSNPYHFWPCGVWWKWIPFRLDQSKNEIAVDTDIICLSYPSTWYDWLSSKEQIIIAPERFKIVKVNTCGDLHKHPLVVGKPPFNCGVVGQRQGYDFHERFFDITKEVQLGETRDSLFITEQGAINVWARSLEVDGIDLYVLDFQKNAWIRDFLYFLLNGITVETVHAVAWHKEIVNALKDVFERKVTDEAYLDQDFIKDVFNQAKGIEAFSKYVVARQLGQGRHLDREILIPGK